jgi:ribosomal RNA methyltransferase Nop2
MHHSATNSELKRNTKGNYVRTNLRQSGKGRKISATGRAAKPAAIPLPADSSEDDEVDPQLDEVAHVESVEEDIESELDTAITGQQDEFLGSDSSVYNSDPDHEKAMFSEDEDESDAEEKLTAANIEGLSRRLDAEQGRGSERKVGAGGGSPANQHNWRSPESLGRYRETGRG